MAFAVRSARRLHLVAGLRNYLRAGATPLLQNSWRSCHELVPSGEFLEVPRVTTLPHPRFELIGGTILAERVYDVVKYLESERSPEAIDPAADLGMVLSHLADVAVAKDEPERENLLDLLFKALGPMSIVPHEELDRIFTNSKISGLLVHADRGAVVQLVDKIWARLPECSEASDILLAARALHCVHSFAPASVLHALHDKSFLTSVRALNAMDAVSIRANLTLLASFLNIRSVNQNLELTEALCNNLAKQLRNAPLPKNVKDANLLVDVAQALVKLRYFHEGMLISLATYFLDLCKAPKEDKWGTKTVTPFSSPHAITHILYSLSCASVPAVALFQELEGHMKAEDMVLLPVELLLHLVWAYHGQELPPPVGAKDRLDGIIAELPVPVIRKFSEEIEQIHDLLLVSRLQVANLLQKHIPPPLQWMNDVKEKYPEAEVDVLTGAGRVSLCAMVRPRDGVFLSWKKCGIEPDELSPELISALPGVPIAVITVFDRSWYHPDRRVNGALNRKATLLKESGWKVIFVDAKQRFGTRAVAVEALVKMMAGIARREMPPPTPEILTVVAEVGELGEPGESETPLLPSS